MSSNSGAWIEFDSSIFIEIIEGLCLRRAEYSLDSKSAKLINDFISTVENLGKPTVVDIAGYYFYGHVEHGVAGGAGRCGHRIRISICVDNGN